MSEVKTVSRFEYAIDEYINENIAPIDMSLVTCKSKEQEKRDRIDNLKIKARKLFSRLTK